MSKRLLCLAVLVLALGCASTARTEEQAKRVVAGNVPATADYAAFGRAYGMLRYYSPNPYTEGWDENDWGQAAILFAERFAAADSLPLGARLQAVFGPLAPLATFTDRPEPGTRKPAGQAYYRRHIGGGKQRIRNIYRVATIPADGTPGTPQPDSIYSFRLGDGIWLNYPVAVEKAAFNKKDIAALRKIASKGWLDGDGKMIDRAVEMLGRETVRIADAVTRWNIVRNFYPYYEEDSLDWEPYLTVMIDSVRGMDLSGTKADLYRYHRLVRNLMHPLADGHLSVWPNIRVNLLVAFYISMHEVPIRLGYAEDRAVVLDAAPDYPTRMRRYDVLETIDGQPVDRLVARELAYVCAATDAERRERALNALMRDVPHYDTTGFVIGFRDAAGVLGYDTLRPVAKSEPYGMGDRETFVRELGGGIYYINAMSEHADGKHLKAYLPQLERAKGIVVDVRGYPNWSFEDVLAHLTDREIDAPVFRIPVTCFPQRIGLSWQESQESISPKTPFLSAPKVFLTNGDAISWGETVMMTVKGNGLGTVIGSATAGTNGDVTYFGLPFFDFPMTGLHASHVDGSRHHGIGVLPDVEVTPTLEGLRAGRDEVLEAAVEYLKAAR